jgi:hypothetical protein
MNTSLGRIALSLVVLGIPVTGFAQDTVPAYAAFCYSELEIKPTDLPDSFACKVSTANGTLLTTFLDGKPLKDVPAGDPNRAGTNILKKCDTPAWLSSGPADHQCYGNNYIQSVTTTGNAEVLGALLCRHKIRDSNRLDDFDDVALILHNQKTGKTCWFNTKQGENPAAPGGVEKVDGRVVPAPHKDTTGYWMKPSDTARIYCGACHDAGPWLNSQWLHSQSANLVPKTRLFTPFADRPANKFITPTYPAAAGVNVFGDWKPTSDFVTVGKTGLIERDAALTAQEQAAKEKLPHCAQCHKVPGRVAGWPVIGDNMSNQRWIGFSVGLQTPAQATTATAMDYDHTHWMPITTKASDRPATRALHEKLYKKHFEALGPCVITKPADRVPPCGTRVLAFNINPHGAGASVSATVVATAQTFTAPAVALSTATPPTPIDVPSGTQLQLDWQADSTFEACTTELTTPPGVRVTSSGGSSGLIGSGANWALPQTPPVLGPLTVPGLYDVSIYCGDTFTGSLQFRISGPAPTSLRLSTIVGGTLRATAFDDVSAQQLSTTVTFRFGFDSLQLSWTTFNVRPNSCTLSGPGVNVVSDGGTIPLTSATSDRTFTLRCTDPSGTERSVTSTLQPVSSVPCDVDDNGQVDVDDINAIMNARNTPALANDPRNVDSDQIITVIDARVCTTRCTKLNCAR